MHLTGQGQQGEGAPRSDRLLEIQITITFLVIVVLTGL